MDSKIENTENELNTLKSELESRNEYITKIENERSLLQQEILGLRNRSGTTTDEESRLYNLLNEENSQLKQEVIEQDSLIKRLNNQIITDHNTYDQSVAEFQSELDKQIGLNKESYDKLNKTSTELENQIANLKQENLDLKQNQGHEDKKLIAQLKSLDSQVEITEKELNT